MDGIRRKFGVAPNLLLALLLLAAQGSALAHAYKHDPASTLAQACTDCVTANQLSSGCVDSTATSLHQCHRAYLQVPQIQVLESLYDIAVRQRGPPTPP